MAAMTTRRGAILALPALAALLLGGCAGLALREPVQVFVVGIEPLEGEGLELRMLVKLRVQNPNDAPIDYDGVSLEMDVQGKRFATGVSDAAGTVPRFGEAIVSVPVSISLIGLVRQAIGAARSEFRGQIAYEMTGTLAGPGFGGMRFRSKGELALPAKIIEGGR